MIIVNLEIIKEKIDEKKSLTRKEIEFLVNKDFLLQLILYKMNQIRTELRESMIKWLEQTFEENKEGEIIIENKKYKILLGKEYRGERRRALKIEVKCPECRKIIRTYFCSDCNLHLPDDILKEEIKNLLEFIRN